MSNHYFSKLSKILPNVSHEIFEDLCIYEALVRRWQPHINLVSKTTLSNLWERHILDSIQLFPLQKKPSLNWLDLGSGGGFPALVLAILLKAQQMGHITLIESNKKKASFLNRVVDILALPASVHAVRIEVCQKLIADSDIITARALAPLNIFFSFVVPSLTSKTVLLLQKGKSYQQELDTAAHQWSFEAITHKSFIHDESVILEISKIYDLKQKKNCKYA